MEVEARVREHRQANKQNKMKEQKVETMPTFMTPSKRERAEHGVGANNDEHGKCHMGSNLQGYLYGKDTERAFFSQLFFVHNITNI